MIETVEQRRTIPHELAERLYRISYEVKRSIYRHYAYLDKDGHIAGEIIRCELCKRMTVPPHSTRHAPWCKLRTLDAILKEIRCISSDYEVDRYQLLLPPEEKIPE